MEILGENKTFTTPRNELNALKNGCLWFCQLNWRNLKYFCSNKKHNYCYFYQLRPKFVALHVTLNSISDGITEVVFWLFNKEYCCMVTRQSKGEEG